MKFLMNKTGIWFLLLLGALPLAGSSWEWQFSLGPWTLQPWTSPAQRHAERIVNDEARRLLAPLLSEFTVMAFEPRVAMSSRGYFLNIGLWRRLAAGRFALGISASYLDFSLPFTLEDNRDISFQGIPIAHIQTSGAGQIDLRTYMLEAHGRWRAFQAGRIAVYAGMGLTLMNFNGDLFLPISASVNTFLGTLPPLHETEDTTLAELRKENDNVPAWILSPALTASLYYRIGAKSRLFIEISLSQGTFLAAGLSWGR
jgi:hypothetical protein